jgi:hypothetical protein
MAPPLLAELLLLRRTLRFCGSRRRRVRGLGYIRFGFGIFSCRACLPLGIAALARAGLGLSWRNIGLGLRGFLRTQPTAGRRCLGRRRSTGLGIGRGRLLLGRELTAPTRQVIPGRTAVGSPVGHDISGQRRCHVGAGRVVLAQESRQRTGRHRLQQPARTFVANGTAARENLGR